MASPLSIAPAFSVRFRLSHSGSILPSLQTTVLRHVRTINDMFHIMSVSGTPFLGPKYTRMYVYTSFHIPPVPFRHLGLSFVCISIVDTEQTGIESDRHSSFVIGASSFPALWQAHAASRILALFAGEIKPFPQSA